jgi:hypothetical protein
MASFYTATLHDHSTGKEVGVRFVNLDAIMVVDLINPNEKPEDTESRVTFVDGSTLEIRGASAPGFFEALVQHHQEEKK